MQRKRRAGTNRTVTDTGWCKKCGDRRGCENDKVILNQNKLNMFACMICLVEDVLITCTWLKLGLSLFEDPFVDGFDFELQT